MDFRYQSGDHVILEQDGDAYQVQIGDKRYRVSGVRLSEGELDFVLQDASGAQTYRAYVAAKPPVTYVALDATVYALVRAETARRQRKAANADEGLNATMHGQVVKVLVHEGDTVTRGQPLVLLEAMKMEIRVNAPHAGRITRLLCQPGQVVERGQLLLALTSESD